MYVSVLNSIFRTVNVVICRDIDPALLYYPEMIYVLT